MKKFSQGGAAQRVPRSHHPSPAAPNLPPPFFSPIQTLSFAAARRDSDASSLGSSRPSVSGLPPSSAVSARPSAADTASHLRAVNSYLASLSPPLHLRPPFPPARDVADALRLILACLRFPNPVSDLARDLPPLLAALRCPIKLSKSALKAPSTPHAWPSVLSVLHWLVQLALVADHVAAAPEPGPTSDMDINSYVTRSYSLFLDGDDGAVADLEAEYLDKLRGHTAATAKEVEDLEAEVARCEAVVRDQAAKATRLEAIEAERAVLLEDANKFENVVGKYAGLIEEKERKLAEREGELERKEMELRRLDEEGEELRGRIKGQKVSARDVGRMTRELEVLEREIAERESRRNEMEEKALLLDSELERKFREIEILAEESNNAIRK